MSILFGVTHTHHCRCPLSGAYIPDKLNHGIERNTRISSFAHFWGSMARARPSCDNSPSLSKAVMSAAVTGSVWRQNHLSLCLDVLLVGWWKRVRLLLLTLSHRVRHSAPPGRLIPLPNWAIDISPKPYTIPGMFVLTSQTVSINPPLAF